MSSYIKIVNASVDGYNTIVSSGIKNILVNLFSSRKYNLDTRVVNVLRNINLTAKKGDKIGILGLNGCGKTSLLRMISGTYPPKSGTIETRGNIVSMIGRGAEFVPNLDAVDNIKISMLYANKFKDCTPEFIDKVLDFAELQDKKTLPLFQYSSGMLVRLAFSVNIFQKANILITDEIFATGDAKFIHKSREKLRSMWNEVDIALTVSHDIEDIIELSNKCFVMDNGSIVYEADTQDAIKFYEKMTK